MERPSSTSEKDTVYCLKAEYFDHPIYHAPLKTAEIIIAQIAISGGTGPDFIIEWKTPNDCPEPLFEGVMNSIVGQQGLSFTPQSKPIPY